MQDKSRRRKSKKAEMTKGRMVGSRNLGRKRPVEFSMNAIYTRDETALILGVSPDAVSKAALRGDLEASRLGRVLRIKGASIDDFMTLMRVYKPREEA